MAELENEDFASGTALASKTYPMQCSALRKNGLVMLKGHPCKIAEMSTSKTGKHGHAKVHLVGLHVVTSKKYEDICPSTHNMDVPVVSRKDYLVMDIGDDGFLSLMDDVCGTKDDLKVPNNELGKEIRDKFATDESCLVTVLTVMDEEHVIAVKPSNQ